MTEPLPASFYDRDYFEAGTKSAYGPYGPGEWVGWLSEMILEHVHPISVLDVGCAYGFVVRRLREAGIPAYGFDISEYAVSKRVVDGIWQGDVTDPAAWQVGRYVDLVLASEVPEHLTETQGHAFLGNAAAHGSRLLLLGVIGESSEADTETDHSHIGVRPVSWWIEAAHRAGWEIDIETTHRLNHDERAVKMSWNGRFLFFDR